MVTKFLIVIAMVVDIMADLYLCPALTAEQQGEGDKNTHKHIRSS